MDRSSLRNWSIAIFLLTFAIRAERLPHLSATDLTFSTITPEGQRSFDEGINIAYAIHDGNGFANPFWAGATGPSAHCAPAFPVVTAALFTVFGTGAAGAIARDVLNIAGYSLLFALLPWFAVTFGMSAAAGVAPGLAAALYPWFGFREISRGRDEWLAAILCMLLLVAALRIARRQELTLSSAAFYGAGWGVLMYVFPALIAVLPIHLLVILFARGRPAARRLAFAGTSLAVLLLAILPWTIRNRLVMGGWMFMRDDLGMELEVSNGDGAAASVDANLASGWLCGIHPTCNPDATVQVLKMGELAFNREAMAKAVAWIENNPSRFGRLTLRRAGAFWLGTPATIGSILFHGGISILGLAGLWLMWRREMRIETALLLAVWVMYPLAFYVVQRVDRYQVPVFPELLLPAGFLSVALYLNLRKSMLNGSKN